jgi:hypothetical protein
MAYSLSNEYISNNKHSKRRRPQILKLKLKLELVFESILRNEIDIFKISRRSKHFRKIGRKQTEGMSSFKSMHIGINIAATNADKWITLQAFNKQKVARQIYKT